MFGNDLMSLKDEVEDLLAWTRRTGRHSSKRHPTHGGLISNCNLLKDSHTQSDCPRPPKRTRTSPDGLPSPISPPPSIPPTPQVKSERSPSPPMFVEKRLVTSGTKRFTPIPSDCLPSCMQYKQNRLEWVARCIKELEALNLIPQRRLLRDDGLVIDWKSHVPVWSDTLQPDPQDLAATIMLTHRSNAQWHPPRKESPLKSVTTIPTQEPPTSSPPISGDVSDAEPPLKKRLPAPPRPSSKRRNNPSQLVSFNSPPSEPRPSSPRSERPRTPERETRSPSRDGMSSLSDPRTDISSRHGPIGVPPKSGGAGDQSIASGTSSAAEEEMSEMTLNYLRRYVQTYEADRATLASAYAGNASFAYRVHHVVQNTSGGPPSVWAPSPECFSSGTKRSRLDIVTTLMMLPCLHLNAHSSGIAQIQYDMFYLGTELGMFVVCRVVDSTRTIVHNFILQRKEAGVEDARIEGVWPLVATAHQILVFQT